MQCKQCRILKYNLLPNCIVYSLYEFGDAACGFWNLVEETCGRDWKIQLQNPLQCFCFQSLRANCPSAAYPLKIWRPWIWSIISWGNPALSTNCKIAPICAQCSSYRLNSAPRSTLLAFLGPVWHDFYVFG